MVTMVWHELEIVGGTLVMRFMDQIILGPDGKSMSYWD